MRPVREERCLYVFANVLFCCLQLVDFDLKNCVFIMPDLVIRWCDSGTVGINRGLASSIEHDNHHTIIEYVVASSVIAVF